MLFKAKINNDNTFFHDVFALFLHKNTNYLDLV
jgi:hypothetical protein